MNIQNYRADIDGLRALAVIAVIGFHAFPNLITGGFIGVDIFFVISGYLITKILLEDLKRYQSVQLKEFYIRRIKRIFPALLVVVSASFIFAWLALLPIEYEQLGKHMASGVGFISNWVFWQETGYFDNLAETKPLLHLWSLGIEEQFYIIWPLLILLAWKKQWSIPKVCISIGIFSFILNLSLVHQYPTATFFLPSTRIWELLSGCLLASSKFSRPISYTNPLNSYCHHILIRFNFLLNNHIQSLIGLALIIGALFFLNKAFTFPGWAALLPVIGTILIINAGSHTAVNQALSHPLIVKIGLISFPLYLWHWPLLSFARIIESQTPSTLTRIIILLISLILAWFTYQLIEKPIRNNHKNNIFLVKILCILAILIGSTGLITYLQEGWPSRFKDNQASFTGFQSPQFNLNRETCHQLYPDYKGNCYLFAKPEMTSHEKIVFLGDSHSETLAAGYQFNNPDKYLISFSTGGCLGFINVERYSKGNPQGCTKSLDMALQYIANDPNIKTVVIHNRFSAYVSGEGFGKEEKITVTPGHLHIQAPEQLIAPSKNLYKRTFATGLQDTLIFLEKAHKKIVFVHQVPELGFNPKMCSHRPLKLTVNHCALTRDQVNKRQESYRSIASPILSQSANILVIDPVSFFCDAENCSTIKNGHPFYWDSDHLNYVGASLLTKELMSKIEGHKPLN